MSFAPSFGSVGDFIAITILIKDVVNALNNATGSKSEYKQLNKELLSLSRAFLAVELLCQTPDQIPEVSAISIQTRRIADQCRDCIQDFLRAFDKYTTTLREKGSGNRVRDAAAKIKWRFEKGKISNFHTEITMHSLSLTMLLNIANV